jgi:Fe-S oxidoreductase
VVLGFPDVYAAADRVVDVMSYGPIGLEGFDDRLVHDVRLKGMEPETMAMLPAGAGWLLVEFGGETMEEANEKARRLMDGMSAGAGECPSALLLDDAAKARRVWKVRESALGATAVVPGRGHAHEGWEDAAVPPARLGDYLRALRALLDRYGYIGDFYGHFGDGCVHTRNDFDLQSKEGIAKFRSYMTDAAHLVAGYGGSFSGEHGDGQSRAELLPIMFGDELIGAFREFKEAWDPNWKMNPGKLVEAYRLDENLRLGEGYRARRPETRFAFADEGGSFDDAVSRCVGVGLCRRESSGTMCPSWMVTREEKHSTRGRARLLDEMLRGEIVTGGWESEDVKEALDLCLACKGCASDCPTQVDVATWKAEFLSHYYETRRRPVAAYAMGWIHRWARLAALSPRLANFFVENPLTSALVRRAGGIAKEREIPRFAESTFRQRQRTGARRARGPRDRVILWVDTFNDHFHPEVLEAAIEVLESGGFETVLPPPNLCCGRPLYDWGFLDMAKRQLLEILDALGEEIAAGTPMVGLEPSCTAVFRDELVNLIPDDRRAERLRDQTFTLAELVQEHRSRFHFAKIDQPMLFHGHCHQKAIMKTDPDERLLGDIASRVDVPDSGCCGMAGAFGFEEKHYDVSVAVGERVLLPAVRDADPETIVVTDGFSCNEQVVQQTGRRPVHLAVLLRNALRRG